MNANAPSAAEQLVLMAVRRGLVNRQKLVERFGRELLHDMENREWIRVHHIVSMTFKAQQWVLQNPS